MNPVLMSFRDGLVTHTVQRERLGQIGHDENGHRWSYVEFAEALSAGEYCEDQANADLLSGATGTVTTGTAAGGDTLIDTGEFTSDDFVGALGATLGDTIANGGGQGFHVVEMVDANTIRVVVHHGDADPRAGATGWETATTTSTTYSLWFPGRVKQGDDVAADNGAIVRGVAQVDVAINTFGWVKQSGHAWVKIDTAGGRGLPLAGEVLTPGAAGLWDGLTTAATTADEVSQAIGKSVLGDLEGTVDGLVMALIDIRNDAVSYRFPRTAHPLN